MNRSMPSGPAPRVLTVAFWNLLESCTGEVRTALLLRASVNKPGNMRCWELRARVCVYRTRGRASASRLPKVLRALWAAPRCITDAASHIPATSPITAKPKIPDSASG